MKPIMLVGASRHSILATHKAMRATSWPFCAVLMYFQLGCARTYMDIRVGCNHNGILATNINLATTPLHGAVRQLASMHCQI